MHRIRRITKVCKNNIEIHGSDSRISMIPTEILSVVDVTVVDPWGKLPSDWIVQAFYQEYLVNFTLIAAKAILFLILWPKC